LSIKRLGQDLVVSWPITPMTFVLEQVSPGQNWTTVTNPASINQDRLEVLIPEPGTPRYFRLKSQ